MRKILSLSLMLLMFAVGAQALTVPAGKAALVEALVGKVSGDQGKGYAKLSVGQELAPGTTVKTGSTGRATLRLPDGSVARIAPNTELNLREEKVRKGVFTRLVKGVARFLVAKQIGGHAFETELPNSVAAVKGTDPEYGTDGKTSYAKVFSSGNPVALLFTDKGSGKETSLKAGEKLSFDGTSFKVEKLDDKDREDSDKNYEGLPPVDKEGDKEGDGKEGGDATPTPTTEGDSGMDEATEEALAEATEDLYLDGFLERDERTGDIMAGKIVFDRFGQRVQVSHFITREDDASVSISSFSLRDDGPNRGVTSAIESATFNRELPENWGSVFRRELNDPENIDSGTGYAIYWRTASSFLAANPAGDSVFVDTLFDDPTFLGASSRVVAKVAAGGGGFVPDPNLIYGPLEQGFSRSLYINGEWVFSLDMHDPYLGQSYPYVSDYGIYPQNSFQTSATPLEGGWSFTYNDYYADFLTVDLHFLNDAGQVLEHPFFAGTPATPTVFRGFDANVEVAFHAAAFEGRSIDLVMLPGFFDIYDMFNTDPYTNYNNF